MLYTISSFFIYKVTHLLNSNLLYCNILVVVRICFTAIWGSARKTRILYVKTVITKKNLLSKHSDLELIPKGSNSKKNITSV